MQKDSKYVRANRRLTFSADALLLAVAVAVIGTLLWLGWGETAEGKPPLPLRSVVWDTDRRLPEPIASLSSLYRVSDRNGTLTVRVEGREAGMALLVWLEGEWVVMPWDETDRGYQAYFNGWLPDYVTVARLPTAAGNALSQSKGSREP